MNSFLTSSSPSSTEALIKDGSVATFMQDVVETSRTVPVVVDFWATWCGPCKTLGPLLEKAVTQAKGAVRMVKIDIDRAPELAQQLRIQSVPTVYAFVDGQVVDGFSGALPESQIKQFMDRLLKLSKKKGDGVDRDLILTEAKEALETGDLNKASALYNQVLSHQPEDATAYAGLVRVMILSGHSDTARQMLDRAPDTMKKAPDMASVKALLELSSQAQNAESLHELEVRAATHPTDYATRFDLAMAYYKAGQREAAIDALLALVKADRQWNDGAARKQLLVLFEAFGPSDSLTLSGRRQLSSILFS